MWWNVKGIIRTHAIYACVTHAYRYATASTAALPPPPHRATLLSGGLALAEKISTKIGTKLSTIGSGGSAASGNMGSGSCNNDDAAVLVRRHMERLSSQWLGVLQVICGLYTIRASIIYHLHFRTLFCTNFSLNFNIQQPSTPHTLHKTPLETYRTECIRVCWDTCWSTYYGRP